MSLDIINIQYLTTQKIACRMWVLTIGILMRYGQANLQNLEFLGRGFDVCISLLQRCAAGRAGAGAGDSMSVCGDAGELEVQGHEAACAELCQDVRQMDGPCLRGDGVALGVCVPVPLGAVHVHSHLEG